MQLATVWKEQYLKENRTNGTSGQYELIAPLPKHLSHARLEVYEGKALYLPSLAPEGYVVQSGVQYA